MPTCIVFDQRQLEDQLWCVEIAVFGCWTLQDIVQIDSKNDIARENRKGTWFTNDPIPIVWYYNGPKYVFLSLWIHGFWVVFDMNGLGSKYSSHIEIWDFAIVLHFWRVCWDDCAWRFFFGGPQEQRAQQSLAKLIVRQVRSSIDRGWFKETSAGKHGFPLWSMGFPDFSERVDEEWRGKQSKPMRTGFLFDPFRRFSHFLVWILSPERPARTLFAEDLGSLRYLHIF